MSIDPIMEDISSYQSKVNSMQYPSFIITNVLLVLIKINNTSINITQDIIYHIFSKYGQIKQILINNDNNQTSNVFVEMNSIASAANAQKQLDNSYLFNNAIKITVMHTNMPSLKPLYSQEEYIPKSSFYNGFNVKSMNHIQEKSSYPMKMPLYKTNKGYNSATNIDEINNNNNNINQLLSPTDIYSNKDSNDETDAYNNNNNNNVEILDELDEQLLLNNFQDKLLFINPALIKSNDTKEIKPSHDHNHRNICNTMCPSNSKWSKDNNQQQPYLNPDHMQHAQNRASPSAYSLNSMENYASDVDDAIAVTSNDHDYDNILECKYDQNQNQNQKEILDMIDKQIYNNLVGKVQHNLTKFSNLIHEDNQIDNDNINDDNDEYYQEQEQEEHEEEEEISNKYKPKYSSMNDRLLGKNMLSPRKIVNGTSSVFNFNMTTPPKINNAINTTSINTSTSAITPPKINNNTAYMFTNDKNKSIINNINTHYHGYFQHQSPLSQSNFNTKAANIDIYGLISPPKYQSCQDLDNTMNKQRKYTRLNPNSLPMFTTNTNLKSYIPNNIPTSSSSMIMNTNNNHNPLYNFLINKDLPLYQNVLDVECKQSQVLYIKGLENKDIKIRMIYNIFSNFGNILKIIFIRNKAAALIEYENIHYSTQTKDYLNNIVFMGKPLKIYYSNYNMINLRKHFKDYGNANPLSSSSSLNEDIFIGNIKNFRFKKNKNISINPPSSTLHISNLIKEICSEEFFYKIFSHFGKVEAIKYQDHIPYQDYKYGKKQVFIHGECQKYVLIKNVNSRRKLKCYSILA